MQPLRIAVLGAAVTLLTVMLALPALAEVERVKMPAGPDTTLDCGSGLVLDVQREGWFQLNNAGEESGVRVTTFHQTHTYTNPNSGESLVIQNTGVANISSEVRIAGITHLATGELNHGLQNLTKGTAAGRVVSPCEILG